MSTDPHTKRDGETAPAPPEGQGPPLAWFESSHRGAVIGATGILISMMLGVTLLQGFSIEWMRYWQPWLALLIVTASFYGFRRRTQVSAGSEWLQRQGGRWVRTYELTRVTAHSRISSIHLHLVDQDGRRVRISNRDIQENDRVWDLVHKGIVHSVIAGGAETNGLLHRAFNIPRPKPGAGS